MVVRDVSGLENRVDREGGYAVYAAVDGCDTANLATVIENAFDGTVQCGTGGNGTVEDEDVFTIDHRLIVVAEDHLSGAVEFRCDDVNGLVSVHGKYTGFGQFFSELGTDHFKSVHADDGVYRNGCFIICCESGCDMLRFSASGFHGGEVQIMRDMRLRSYEMSRNHFQLNAAVTTCIDFNHFVLIHNKNLLS